MVVVHREGKVVRMVGHMGGMVVLHKEGRVEVDNLADHMAVGAAEDMVDFFGLDIHPRVHSVAHYLRCRVAVVVSHPFLISQR